jgi:NAD(P)H-hydrate epimerase
VIPVLTADQMRRADRLTIEEIGLPGPVLMENAGTAVAEVIRERFPEARRIVVLCGKGNNGGDGFVVARRLREHGAEALLLGRREDVKGDALLHLQACERSGGRVREVRDPAEWAAVAPDVASADILVDALLGTGLKSRARGPAAAGIEALERAAEAGIPVVAVDLPSGLQADSGVVDGPVVPADLTVTFAAPKWGHVLAPASEKVGELALVDIGIPEEVLERVDPSLFLLEDEDAARAFPTRARAAHKGTYGHVLVVGGSTGKSGAVVLAGVGALRSGAGLVTVATPASCLPVVAVGRSELMTEPLPESPGGGLAEEATERVLALARERDSVVLGPGLGQNEETRQVAVEVVRRCPVPLIVDADGLNALATSGDVPGLLRGREAPTVLTPHPGEMARLSGQPVADIQRDRVASARALAEAAGVVVVLKGQGTVVALPEGHSVVNPTGNPGMATAGTGDVLAGVIGSLLAHRECGQAAIGGVFVHGRAGDLAAGRLGEDALVAGDVADALPEAIASLRGS